MCSGRLREDKGGFALFRRLTDAVTHGTDRLCDKGLYHGDTIVMLANGKF